MPILANFTQKTRTHILCATVWCWFWPRGIIGPFFFENEQGETVIVNGDHYRAMSNKFVVTKIKEEDIGNVWFQQDGVRYTQPKPLSTFCALFLKIALSAAKLMPFGHFGAAIWHHFKALKDNIHEAIGEIQLHTIYNVLKYWTDRVGYYMASRGRHLNEIIFHY